MVPDYWPAATRALAADDAVMAELVRRYAGFTLVSRGDAFTTLARAIVGQQISVKAADAVWARFAARLEREGEMRSGRTGPTPERLLAIGAPGLAGCGLSARKTDYLLDLARHFAEGLLHPGRWLTMDDDAVIAELTAVRGIGRWTAEMFLIFNLLRPDVYPLQDLGLVKAIRLHYFAGEDVPLPALAAFGERWRPWRTVATWYLWRSLDPVPVTY
ncbi:DNA-3-methyladenine glycosylase family protein [Oryzomicrobium terrae]|nr:DNA-3-methyladenine glycosylase [Oryzomicrobium terrae]